MKSLQRPSARLKDLARYLEGRRESILAAWQCAVDMDPSLTTASTITRAQFIDHIPAVLDAFQRRLAAESPADVVRARKDQDDSAAEHGLHRWQQGYNQPETMCEWGHLHLCLLQELDRYEALHSDLEVGAMTLARHELVRLCSNGVCESASRYAQMQQSEAASRVRELETAMSQLRALEVQRAETWREAAHDLRGTAHVITNVSAVLSRADVAESKRAQFSEILRTGVVSLNKLLSDLMDHARLEAGQEQRHFAQFDAASLLKEFCDVTRPMAAQRNLFLKSDGPDSLIVIGDAAKVQRIVQNLVFNALKVTQQGGVEISWEAGADGPVPQWALCVQDTGPGLRTGVANELERNLKQATNEARVVEEQNQPPSQSSLQSEPAPTLPSQSTQRASQIPSGEGIGLSIVKRLCELLDASLELETAPGEGTTFRVIFPRFYGERGSVEGSPPMDA